MILRSRFRRGADVVGIREDFWASSSRSPSGSACSNPRRIICFPDIMHGIMITMSPDSLLALCIGAMFEPSLKRFPSGTAVAITTSVSPS